MTPCVNTTEALEAVSAARHAPVTGALAEVLLRLGGHGRAAAAEALKRDDAALAVQINSHHPAIVELTHDVHELTDCDRELVGQARDVRAPHMCSAIARGCECNRCAHPPAAWRT